MRPTSSVPWIDCLTCGQRVAPAVYAHHKLFHRRRALGREWVFWGVVFAVGLGGPWIIGVLSILYFCLERW